ncbi:MAG: hypothetical protein QM762_09965 [Chryseolinea sp.]
MRRTFVSLLWLAFTISIQGCNDEDEPCEDYRLTSQVDADGTKGGDLTFTYNADGTLQKVSGANQAEDNFSYDGAGQLIRVEKTREDEPKVAWLFYSDAKGRVISKYREDNFPGDSAIFEYDDNDRIIKVTHYGWGTKEIFFYYDVEYPDASTVKRTVYLRGQYTPELSLSVIHIYKIDNHPRPHPKEYYFADDLLEQFILPHNVLSKYMTGPTGVTFGEVITHTYSYNGRGYPSVQDVVLKYVYECGDDL